MIERRAASTSRQCTIAAREIMDISPNRPIHTLVMNFSDDELRLSKQMEMGRTARTLCIIHALNTDDREAFPIGTPQASANFKLNDPDGTIKQQASRQSDVLVLHYKAAKS